MERLSDAHLDRRSSGGAEAQNLPVSVLTSDEPVHPGPGEPGVQRKKPQGVTREELESGPRVKNQVLGLDEELVGVLGKNTGPQDPRLIPLTSKVSSLSEPQLPHL